MLWSVTTGAKRRQVLSGAGAMVSLKRRSSVSLKFEAQMLAEKGINDAAFTQAVVPLRKSLGSTIRRNEWWFGTVLPRAGSQPFRLSWAAGIQSDYEAATAAELSALAKVVFAKEPLIVIANSMGSPVRAVEPKAKAGAGEIP